MKKLTKFIAALSVGTLCTLSAVSASAAAGDYIVIFENEPALRLYDASVSKIASGIYLAEDKESAEEFALSGKAAFVIPDEEITITDWATEELILNNASLYADTDSETEIEASAEPSAEPSPTPTADPNSANDTLFPSQWYLDYINASAAWKSGYNGKGVKVAVIDSGLYTGHGDFRGVSIPEKYNVMNNTVTTDVTDNKKHGTFVSGIIAAKTNNKFCAAGIADGISLVPIKVTDKSEFNISSLYAGIQKAIDAKCDIINLSLGFVPSSDASKQAMDYLIQEAYNTNNAIIIAAAGNDGAKENGGAYHYPASLDHVISVGSVGREYKAAEDAVNGVEFFSRKFVNDEAEKAIAPYEPSVFTQHNDKVTCVAPGYYVYGLGTSASNAVARQTSGGTSFTTPQVTAAAAIARQIRPSLTYAEFEAAVIATAKDVYTEGYDNYTGYGLIDIEGIIGYVKALNGIQQLSATAEYDADNNIVINIVCDELPFDVSFTAIVTDAEGKLVGERHFSANKGDKELSFNTELSGTNVNLFTWKDAEQSVSAYETININLPAAPTPSIDPSASPAPSASTEPVPTPDPFAVYPTIGESNVRVILTYPAIAEPASFLLASYDADGRLIGLAMTKENLGSTATVVSSNLVGAEVKLFIWGGESGISPVHEPIMIIAKPTPEPTEEPTIEPTVEPTAEPTVEPTAEPTVEPTAEPTVEPTVEPTAEPTVEPTAEPTVEPTIEPTIEPSPEITE